MAFVSVSGLTKRFDKTDVVHDIAFELEKGNCISLLGPNGAGKTTTLRMLAGLMKPTSGSIVFEGHPAHSDIREVIGYLPQHPVFHYWMTGKEFLVYVGRLAHLSKKDASNRAEVLLEKVGIADAKNRRISKYSGGMKQRLGIAQAMIHQPKLLILDEPVSALDPIGRREVLNLLEDIKKGTTILFSTHILSDAEEVSDELLLMHNGEIVESGRLDDLQFTQEATKLKVSFSQNSDTYAEDIESLESVENVLKEGKHLTINTHNTDQARSAILQLAAEQNWPITHFEVSRTSLEDLFMKVVKQ
ncbi:ATP-binding cassette domain-containing protein [Pontibacillus yanchengensis]|uniref:ATP-binding cassette domain-containing protein n=2 Tax=Pontibacillus yanchengensis TaxID=462910 RepID=A0A6I5A4H0_9BACI|nr:ABC transporter ATP-binding protein [Pontibacillus yanchengensis]MYL35224.1 ATP-binding cassette domain-containing protein [Pontibacillus yanchengensis]MYL54834.1 ATP-binding cassette domain-containing protein [Pontibacillus yanchengensis]